MPRRRIPHPGPIGSCPWPPSFWLFLALIPVAAIVMACGARTAAKPLMSRADFKAKVMGKTEAEVIEAVGRPEETAEGVARFWTYGSVTFDSVTSKPDRFIQVSFDTKTGRVRSVSFF